MGLGVLLGQLSAQSDLLEVRIPVTLRSPSTQALTGQLLTRVVEGLATNPGNNVTVIVTAEGGAATATGGSSTSTGGTNTATSNNSNNMTGRRKRREVSKSFAFVKNWWNLCFN